MNPTLPDMTVLEAERDAAVEKYDRLMKEVINRIFGIIAPLVDDATWDEAHAKRIRKAKPTSQ